MLNELFHNYHQEEREYTNIFRINKNKHIDLSCFLSFPLRNNVCMLWSNALFAKKLSFNVFYK